MYANRGNQLILELATFFFLMKGNGLGISLTSVPRVLIFDEEGMPKTRCFELFI
ncbi:hypothetical protein IGJ28_002599 [Enterococcus sp. AZ091]